MGKNEEIAEALVTEFYNEAFGYDEQWPEEENEVRNRWEKKIVELLAAKDEALALKEEELEKWRSGINQNRVVKELSRELTESQKEVERLEQKIADLECADPKCNPLRAKIEALESFLSEAVGALQLILPLAKGYAAEHPVGSNQDYVLEAERVDLLSRKDGQS